MNKFLISFLVTGPFIFTFAWIVLGFYSTGYTMWDITINNYSTVAQPISGLGLGSTAFYMNTAFILSGLLIILGSIGFAKELPNTSNQLKFIIGLLLSLVGIGAIMDGIFTLESFLLHSVGFLFALSPILSFIFIGSKLKALNPNWKKVGLSMQMMSPVLLVLTILYFVSFDPIAAGNNEGYAGITERLLLVVLMGCYSFLGIRAYTLSISTNQQSLRN